MVLYYLWVLVNRLLTVGFAFSATTVVLSAAVFGRIIQRQWLPRRPEIDYLDRQLHGQPMGW